MAIRPDEPKGAPGANKGTWQFLVRALRHRNYTIYIVGQLVSVIGTWMQIVAQSWLAYRLSQSALTLGLVGFVGQIPVFLLGPIAGVVADRYDRRKLLVITQILSTIQALVLAVLTLTHTITIPAIYVLSLFLGIFSAFDYPVRQAFIVELVDREDLVNAIALNTSIWNGARVVGPALAGMAVAALGEGICFLFNAVSFGAAIASLLILRLPTWQRVVHQTSHWAHFREGWQYVRTTMPILSLLMVVGTMSLVGYSPLVLMPVFAQNVLGGGAATLGWLMGAMGVGTFVGGMSLAGQKDIRGLGAVVGVTTGVYGAAMILFALSHRFGLSILISIPMGFYLMRQSAASSSLLQVLVPDALRGRVMSFYSMMWLGMTPVASLWAGEVASHVGAPGALILGGSIAVITGVIFALLLPKFWSVAGAMLARQEASVAEPVAAALSNPETDG